MPRQLLLCTPGASISLQDPSSMNDYYVDLHIHIGRTESGKPVKISGSRDLTFYNIAHESAMRKGIDMIGIIDCHAPGVQEVLSRGGFMIPAHIFTPYKSVYGSGSNRIAHMLDLNGLAAVELGLSADTSMASYLSELDHLAFVTNSDAHSLGKIGREYNQM